MDDALPIIVMGWIICGIIAAMITNSRGGSGVAGFLVGLFLGPIGLIVAFFLGDDSGREQRELALGDRKKCPDCAELVRAEAQVCRFCQHRFA